MRMRDGQICRAAAIPLIISVILSGCRSQRESDNREKGKVRLLTARKFVPTPERLARGS